MPELTALYVDAALLVLDKPAGLLAVPGRGADKLDCLASRAQARYADARIVHRLDMATSGLMLMARGAEHQRLLSAAFAERRVHKRYEAVVAGHLPSPAEAWGLIDLPLAADWPNRPLQKVDNVAGKPSQTRYRVVGHDTVNVTTRLELEPITGRSHQLRVHLQAIGHPILGDGLYAPAGSAAMAPRLLLHATRLALQHPVSGESLRICSPAPF